MHPTNRPLAIRLWNKFSIGKTDRQPLLRSELLDAAIRRSGFSCFGETDFLEGLEVFLDSISNSGGLHSFGQFYLRQLIIAMLVHRLKLVNLMQVHPEIHEQHVNGPVFVLGMPRSGTTLLFNLLSQDSRHRFMFNWESFIGQVPPKGRYTFETDPRRKQAVWMIRFQRYLLPGIDKIHEFSALGPEECTPILMQSFATSAFVGQFNVPAYSAWLDHANRDPTYRHHKMVLQALQWKYPGEHWLLKSPDHLAGVKSILKLHPGAKFIHIHRDPVKCIPSWASLNLALQGPYYSEVDVLQLGTRVLDRLGADMDQYILERPTEQENQFCDVHYRDLTRNPIDTIRRVYGHFGFDLTSDTENRMLSYLSDNPEKKYGAHRYKASDFGLSDKMIRQRFERYIDRFDVSADSLNHA